MERRLNCRSGTLQARSGEGFSCNYFDILINACLTNEFPMLSFKNMLDRFRSITQSYYRSAHALILVYDVSNQVFPQIQRTFENQYHHCQNKMPLNILCPAFQTVTQPTFDCCPDWLREIEEYASPKVRNDQSRVKILFSLKSKQSWLLSLKRQWLWSWYRKMKSEAKNIFQTGVEGSGGEQDRSWRPRNSPGSRRGVCEQVFGMITKMITRMILLCLGNCWKW